MNKLLNYINVLNISTNSLILILISLVAILIILVITLLLKNNSSKNTVSFLENDVTTSIKDIEIDNSEMNNLNAEIATKIELPKNETPKSREKFDISIATKQMEEDINSDNINLTDFEIEQEEKSIISYKELLEKVNKDKINISSTNSKDNIKTVEIKNGNENSEYTFNTEVIDFEAEIEKQAQIKKNQEKTTILNIEENDYSHDDFLNSLKTLKDSLG